jgi:hypothetical protein
MRLKNYKLITVVMTTTKIQIFGGNVGVGTNDPGAYKLNINGGTSTFEGLEVTNLTVGGVEKSYAPTGLILMWSGAIAQIPAGWVLCDGTNGTPNLKAKFILGHDGVTYTSPSSGGSHTKTITTSNIPQHNHPASSASAAVHSHTDTITNSGYHIHNSASTNTENHWHGNNNGTFLMVYAVNGAWYSVSPYARQPGGYHLAAYTSQGGGHNHPTVTVDSVSHYHNVSVGSAGNHSHTAGTTDSTGSGTAFDVRPEYYVLAYIMKT